jgi:hypothetical protein
VSAKSDHSVDRFLRLSAQIGNQLTDQRTTEQEVLDDFAVSRRRR